MSEKNSSARENHEIPTQNGPIRNSPTPEKDLPGASARPIIRVEGMHVSFGGQDVTHGVSLDLVPGRVTALVGESGSGKSVTAMALPHLDPSVATVTGRALLRTGNGDDAIDLLSDNAPLQQIRGGEIGTIFQEPMTAFNPLMTIGRQIEEALDYHPHAGGDGRDRDNDDKDERNGRDGRRLTRREKREQVLAQLREVGLPDAGRIARSHPHELSGGQLQRAMIAMAIINRPPVLIADEPTTALDVTTQKGILDLLDRLTRERRLAVLLITHDMGVVWQAADDVYVMHDGRIVEKGGKEQVFAHPRQEYTRTLLEAVPRLDVASLRETSRKNHQDWQAEEARCTAESAGAAGRSPSLAVEDLTVRYGHGRSARTAVEHINLEIHAGQTLALVGESGAGKTTIARTVSGQLRPSSGRVLLDGVDLAGLRGRALRRERAGIGYIFQDSGSALNPYRTVGWSIAEPLQIAGWGAKDRQARVDELLGQVSLPAGIAARRPSELSGGQRQRIGIARALALRPSLLIADEPTSALDVTVQKRVLDLLHRLHGEYGYACLFITHDLGIVQEVADRVAVISNGRIVEEGPMVDVLTHPRQDYTRQLLAASPEIAVRPDPLPGGAPSDPAPEQPAQ